MSKLTDLIEAVTQTKLVKLNGKLRQLMTDDRTFKYRFLDLDWRDPKVVEDFCKECFGDPKGLYINTLDEQKGLLRRIYNDYHQENGSNFMRMEFTDVNVD